jgi:hypothetical protein
MPKFNLSINGVGQDIAEGREDWSGPLPPKGSYPAILKLVRVKQIKGKTDNRLQIMAVLNTGDQYDGCPVWGGVNLTDQGIPYVNQFLASLTDGSESEIEKIEKAFYTGFVVDEKKTEVLKIGTKRINSPDGKLPIMISLGHSTYEGKTNPKIMSFLLPGGGSAGGGSSTDEEEVAEEDDDVDVTAEADSDDGSIFDDEDEDAEESASV